MPEVDVGDDIFVVEDASGDLQRVQVKTGNVVKYKHGDCYRVQFSISVGQIKASKTPDLFYCFVPVINEEFGEIVTLERKRLEKYLEEGYLGSVNKEGNINLRIRFRDSKYFLDSEELSAFVNLPQFKKIVH